MELNSHQGWQFQKTLFLPGTQNDSLLSENGDSKEWGHGKLVGELHEQQLPRRLRGGEGIPPQVLICQFVFYQSSTLYLGELHD